MKDFSKVDPKLQIFAYIFLVSNRLQATMDKSVEEITAKQWFLLATLAFHDEPPTLTQLANAMESSHQNVRQLANKLRDKGFLRMEADLKDRRSFRIYPTDKVLEWDNRTRQMQIDFIANLFDGIESEGIKCMEKYLKKLFENLGAINEKNR